MDTQIQSKLKHILFFPSDFERSYGTFLSPRSLLGPSQGACRRPWAQILLCDLRQAFVLSEPGSQRTKWRV